MKFIVIPYNKFSRSYRSLRKELRKVSDNRGYLFINWGLSANNGGLTVEGEEERLLNHFDVVRRAANKITTYNILQDADVNIPQFWLPENYDSAKTHARRGGVLVCRRLVSSHSGRGIDIVDSSNVDTVDFNQYKVITKYIKKKKEFRVHVFQGEVIDVQQKRKRSDYDGQFNNYIRAYNNGWVYCREDVNYGQELELQSKTSILSLGLDFGAVDVIWNERENKYYVLEINTAPGIEGTTLSKYVDAIVEYSRSL